MNEDCLTLTKQKKGNAIYQINNIKGVDMRSGICPFTNIYSNHFHINIYIFPFSGKFTNLTKYDTIIFSFKIEIIYTYKF